MIRAIIFGAGAAIFLATLPTLAQTTRVEPTATSKRSIKLEAPSGSPAVPLGQPSTPSAFREMRAGDLIGERVYNTGGESMGQIEDIVVNRGNNAIAALVGMGGFLGVGEKQVAVLLSDLEMQGDSIVVKDLTRTDFQRRLAYQANDWARHDRNRLIDGAMLR
jgi:sporulation protein YlmC with PRC-barrel domain